MQRRWSVYSEQLFLSAVGSRPKTFWVVGLHTIVEMTPQSHLNPRLQNLESLKLVRGAKG